ncbi:MAG: tyrosine-type recombinase/integrase [Treponema sp.]|uniref:tyrosine-type recombinase/integrase n=1 Tax=Treponema sp. TaxID=166 RepID=UPI001D228BE9|nr:site-specific integrase [Treponema sp.]MBS7310610.1 tyrosine-type recombinase/integrase [Treponema sp.]
MAEPYYLYTRRQGGNYYVQFRLEDGSLSNHKSTGTPNYNEARKLAMQWYSSDQIPERINSKEEKLKMTEVDKIQLMKNLKTFDFEYDDIQNIVDILIERKYLVSGILKASPESRQAVDYLLEFWDFDKSPYREERAVLGKQLSYTYFETALGRVKKYWAPRLEGKLLGEITPDDIAAIYSDERIKKLSSKTVKDIVDVMVVAMNWTHQKHLTQFSNFQDIPKVTVQKTKKKEILRPEFVSKVFSVGWGNEMSRLANLLAMYTGMRADEVQALRVCDIHENYIWISHGWDDHLGLKTPKNGEERPAPISKELREALLHMVEFNPRYSIDKENSFIFFGKDPVKPVCQRLFNKYLHRALEECGYPNPNKIGFHCWRHGFCTETKTLVNDDRMIRQVSGHKTQAVFEHYSDHLEMKDTIEAMGNAAETLFGSVVERTLNTPVLEEELA